jgi:hypothetical protein
LSSEFDGGNLQNVSFQEQLMVDGKVILLVEFWGNSDTELNSLDKSWFYFKVNGLRNGRMTKWEEVIFRFKNANIYRKFIKEKLYKPYIVAREEREEGGNNWKTIYFTKFNVNILRS